MSSIKPLIAAPRSSAPSQASQHADGSSPEQRAEEEIALKDPKQRHEHGEYEHESAPPEHTTHKEKVDEAATAKDLPYAMHVLAPVPRESRGGHARALTRYSAAGCLQPVGWNGQLGGVEFISGHPICRTAGISRRRNSSVHVIATTRSKLANSKGAAAMPERSRHHPAMPGNTAMAT